MSEGENIVNELTKKLETLREGLMETEQESVILELSDLVDKFMQYNDDLEGRLSID
jgi:hypothetical protein